MNRVMQKITGGTHTHNYNFQQGELPVEKRDRRVTLVLTDSEFEAYSQIAQERGFSQLGPFLRKMAEIGIKYERFRNMTLDDILTPPK